MRRGWWNPSAFHPNFVAIGFDLVALVRAFQAPPQQVGPRAGSPASLAGSDSYASFVSSLQSGMGAEAWATRGEILPQSLDPTVRECLLLLMESEQWGVYKDEDWGD